MQPPQSKKGLIAFWIVVLTMFLTWLTVVGGVLWIVALCIKALNKYLAG